MGRRLREEGALSLMTEGDVARVPERRSCLGAGGLEAPLGEELELENAILAGTVEIMAKRPRRRPSAPTAAERRRWPSR